MQVESKSIPIVKVSIGMHTRLYCLYYRYVDQRRFGVTAGPSMGVNGVTVITPQSQTRSLHATETH